MDIFKKYIPLNIFNIESTIQDTSLSKINLSDSESLLIFAQDKDNKVDTYSKNFYFRQNSNIFAFGAPTELVQYISTDTGGKEEYNFINNDIEVSPNDLTAKVVIPYNVRGKLGKYGEKDILLRDLEIRDLPETLLTEIGNKLLNSSTFIASLKEKLK